MYFLEVGLVLIVIPWSSFWDRNVLVDALPALQSMLRNNFVRGAVSGVGLINLGAGFVELLALLRADHRRPGLRDHLSVGMVDSPDR